MPEPATKRLQLVAPAAMAQEIQEIADAEGRTVSNLLLQWASLAIQMRRKCKHPMAVKLGETSKGAWMLTCVTCGEKMELSTKEIRVKGIRLALSTGGEK